MSYPSTPINNVPASGSPGFPTLNSITTADLVGPTAANRQPVSLETRTNSLKTSTDEAIDAINGLATAGPGSASVFLLRDGSEEMAAALGMGGFVISNLADPSAADHALNLGYADARYVNVSGDTITGTLTVDGYLTASGGLGLNGTMNVNNQVVENVPDPTQPHHAANAQWAGANFVNRAGDSGIGPIRVTTATPVDSDELAAKAYVDTKLPLAGGTMNAGAVINMNGGKVSMLQSPPSGGLDAAPKQWVLDQLAGAGNITTGESRDDGDDRLSISYVFSNSLGSHYRITATKRTDYSNAQQMVIQVDTAFAIAANGTQNWVPLRAFFKTDFTTNQSNMVYNQTLANFGSWRIDSNSIDFRIGNMDSDYWRWSIVKWR